MDSLLLRQQIDGSIGRLVLAACIILVLVLVPSAEVTAASPDGWAIQTSGTGLTLYGVWGASPTDVFAVGENGTILHYDGSSWESMSSGVSLSDSVSPVSARVSFATAMMSPAIPASK